MGLEDFVDFKALKNSAFLSTNEGSDGAKLNWGSVKWIHLEKDRPDHLYFKSEFWDTSFKELKTSEKPKDEDGKDRSKRRNKKQKKIKINLSICFHLTKEKLALSEANLKDLEEMCKTGTIPRAYHQFYDELKAIGDPKIPAIEKKLNNRMKMICR